MAGSCALLSAALDVLLRDIGDVQIGNRKQFPLGWRKAAKGRSVWRLLEELISQNLETRFKSLGVSSFSTAFSEGWCI